MCNLREIGHSGCQLLYVELIATKCEYVSRWLVAAQEVLRRQSFAADLTLLRDREIYEVPIGGFFRPPVQPLVKVLEVIAQSARAKGMIVVDLKRVSEQGTALLRDTVSYRVAHAWRPKKAGNRGRVTHESLGLPEEEARRPPTFSQNLIHPVQTVNGVISLDQDFLKKRFLERRLHRGACFSRTDGVLYRISSDRQDRYDIA
jgi:hypothetical protein